MPAQRGRPPGVSLRFASNVVLAVLGGLRVALRMDDRRLERTGPD
jgi:hypothetical protein